MKKQKDIQRQIKGFEESYVFDLYTYICRFEKIKDYKKKEDLQKYNPKLSNKVEKEVKAIKRWYPKKKDWDSQCLTSDAIDVNTFYDKSTYCKVYSILLHIRNAIAHGNIVVCEDKLVKLEDFDIKGKSQTANALIHLEIFNNIVKCINENIKL